jgi:antitoxin component of RelBE/YafQ-DinJ toxin-antitoxin module
MSSKPLSPQIPFRYRNVDSPTGVTRATAQQLAERMGVDETQAIHLALRQLATKMLPQYEQDDGPLTAAQVLQIKKIAPRSKKKSVRTSLFDAEPS